MPSGQSSVLYSVDRELVRLTPGISPQVSAVVVEFHSIPIVIGGLSTGFIALAFSARAVASRISAAATSGSLRIAEYLSIPSLTATVLRPLRRRRREPQAIAPWRPRSCMQFWTEGWPFDQVFAGTAGAREEAAFNDVVAADTVVRRKANTLKG